MESTVPNTSHSKKAVHRVWQHLHDFIVHNILPLLLNEEICFPTKQFKMALPTCKRCWRGIEGGHKREVKLQKWGLKARLPRPQSTKLLDKCNCALKSCLSIIYWEDLPPPPYIQERCLNFKLLIFMQRHLPSAQCEASNIRDPGFKNYIFTLHP